MLTIDRALADSCKSVASSSSHQPLFVSSAEKIAHIDDLLIELLAYLPVKSLFKFKTVSKQWLSLISNPDFCLRRNLVTRSVSAIIVLSKYRPGRKRDQRKVTKHGSTKYELINLNSDPSLGVFKNLTFSLGTVILHSCNGLLLCGNVDWRKPMHQCFILNPITKQRTKLPHIIGSPPDDYGGSPTIFGINLAFDPLKSPHYKVICIRNCDSSDEGGYQMEIYSSETNGPWRLSGGTVRALSYMKYKEGVFWNGALHWFTCLVACLYFTVDEETIHELPMPPLPKGTFLRKCYYFGECRGHLHLIEVYNPCTIFNVYEMRRDYSGWFVKYHVDLGEVVNAYREMAKVILISMQYYVS
ncbi:hypothetical protein Patl1_20705 [Pistacia atlantica]|uniref:Uncharacterized protein n=1 Tax=Pistacia atlantica TaxID=434234 RepID=A0ACC1BHJ8_9ROSI|nr:hypothetical protein Patl1_20705 [Pistacia atlantica]